MHSFTDLIGATNYSLDEATISTGWLLDLDNPPFCEIDGVPIITTFDGTSKLTNITVEPGKTTECIFTNLPPGSFTILKSVLGGPDPTPFDFALNGVGGTFSSATVLADDGVGGSNSNTFSLLFANQDYTATETVPPGWEITGILCTSSLALSGGTGSQINILPESVEVPKLLPGDDITCTFENAKRAEFVWEKRSSFTNELAPGGTFTISPNPFDLQSQDPLVVEDCLMSPCTGPDTDPVGGKYIVINVPPNVVYTITETIPPPGFNLDSTAKTTTPQPGQTVQFIFLNSPLGSAMFLIIDEDSIGKDDEPFTTTRCYQYLNPDAFIGPIPTIPPTTTSPGCGGFPVINGLTTETAVNDDKAAVGLRDELRFFDNNKDAIIELQIGHISDQGWFAPQVIPSDWDDAGPTEDGIRNFFGNPANPPTFDVGPGLGTPDTDGDREALLDKIPDVRPIRYHGLLGLLGMNVCAVVYDGDISINYNEPENEFPSESAIGVKDGSLKGSNLGVVAFNVQRVIPFGGPATSFLDQADDPQEIAKVEIKILDPEFACKDLVLYDAPNIIDEDTSDTFIDLGIALHGSHDHPFVPGLFGFDPFDSGFGEDASP